MSKALPATLAALALSSLVAVDALAQLPPIGVPRLAAAGMVRSYFDALRRQDAARLHEVTTGEAATKTQEVLDRIHTEAKKRHVGLELRVADLLVSPLEGGGATRAVNVRFNIRVIAHKWLFSILAHELRGGGTFYVGGAAGGDVSAAKIVGINLHFD